MWFWNLCFDSLGVMGAGCILFKVEDSTAKSALILIFVRVASTMALLTPTILSELIAMDMCQFVLDTQVVYTPDIGE